MYGPIIRVSFEANVERRLKEQIMDGCLLQRFTVEIPNARKVAIIIMKLKLN